MRTVILVPRRAGLPERDKLWKWCKAWWAENVPDLPMFEGHHDHGLFNRSAAINTAAKRAGEWDVALIIDADVILDDPRQAYTAAHTAQESGKLVIAFTTRKSLSRRGTDKIFAGHDKSDWGQDVEREYRDQHSSVIAVPFELWQEVGGFDEGFRGWGHEDTAFAVAAETFAGERITMPGVVWHLWHPTAPEKDRSPARATNWNRVQRYKDIWGDKVAMRALLDEALSAEQETSIPQILHRVVPEQTSALSEQWWLEFQALHPGWRFMTWRDPIDPKLFPITSPLWEKATCGAQLADLVRLEALWEWGGVYVDADMRPFRSLNTLLSNQVVAAWEDHRVVPNAFMAARRQHPAIEACLDMVVDRFAKGHEDDVWACGPGVTTEIFTSREDVMLLSPESVYPVHYREQDRDRLMAGFSPDEHPWTYMLHGYWHSWAPDPRDRRVPE